jgi:hypothetical protein
LLFVPRSPDIPDFRTDGLEFLQELLFVHDLGLCVLDQHQRGVVVRLAGVDLKCRAEIGRDGEYPAREGFV